MVDSVFVSFFYKLKEVGVPVSPTSFLTFHRAMHSGLVSSVHDFYIVARTILIKSEKHFDLYDQVFDHVFAGTEIMLDSSEECDFWAHSMLDEWLKNPKQLAASLGVDVSELSELSPPELLDYFKKRLQEQKGRHDGGSKWIGTGGTSPVGHSGYHPGGMRVGGQSRYRTAAQVAAQRRYRDYSGVGPLAAGSIGEALRKLKNLVPRGARDRLDVDATIHRTLRNGGEIEPVFGCSVVDRLKIILAIDNGGWSMEPYVEVVQALFSYSRSQFKDLKTYFFHNTIYDLLWEDPGRRKKPKRIDEFVRNDPETRLIIIGDASMAPYELMVPDGSIHAFEKSGRPSIERLKFLHATFRHSVWLNPVAIHDWNYSRTIQVIGSIFPMYELSLEGLESAITYLMQKQV